MNRHKLDYLNGLNKCQVRAATFGLERGPATNISPLIVIAGAGSGKTRTLAHRVVHLIHSGIDPRRILLLTFSRRAAEEMRTQVKRAAASALAGQRIDLPWAGTFHAIGAKLIREYGHELGLNPSFTILDRSDAADLMNLIRQDLGLASRDSPFPAKDTCLAIYSFMINSQKSLKTTLRTKYRSWLRYKNDLRKLFQKYENAKRRQHVLDYDDLLTRWADLMANDRVAEHVRSRFDHVLVDEYQDTNRLQAKILFKLKPDGRDLTVVGDDAQAIYSFRAATVRNILEFPQRCEPTANVIKLEQNYRSTQPILTASNAVIGFATARYTKDLFSERKSKQKPCLTVVADEATQARYVAQQIIDARECGVPLRAQATLFRTSSQATALELELIRRKVPFVKYGGLKFLESAHIKDVLSTLRWCENPSDRVAGFRVLRLLPGIGPNTAARILEEMADDKGRGVSNTQVTVPRAAKEGWIGLRRLVRKIVQPATLWPQEITPIREWYEPLLRHNHDDADARLVDLIQLEQIASGFGSRERFLTDLAIDPPEGTRGRPGPSNKDDDYTVLSTIHSAKGQEWKIVRVLNVVDGCIPTYQADDIEEERRLLYVAMTRARTELDLVVPQRFFRYLRATDDRHTYGSISRFIPVSIRAAFECRRWGEPNNLCLR